jgi:hypothetical protein
MLIGLFMRTKDRAARVRNIFREYLTASRDHTEIIAQRALAVALPDQEPLLRNCFRMQALFIERHTMRFGFLLKSKAIDCLLFKSLDDITARLDKDWLEVEEHAICARNSHYKDVMREIEAIQSHWDAEALTVPLQRLHQDPKYRDASKAMADRVAELQRRVRDE